MQSFSSARCAALVLTLATSHANAHDLSCDGDPVPKSIKTNCCGKADDHVVKPEQITRGPDGEYIVKIDAFVLVIPEDKALPSGDSCSHVFYGWVDETGEIPYDPKMTWAPDIYCFLTPMNF